nr:putative reverse transcriptase, RNA-dependent DNA polymerase [Tanacetum cinerariifolium]
MNSSDFVAGMVSRCSSPILRNLSGSLVDKTGSLVHLNIAASNPPSLGYSILKEVPHNVYNKAHQRTIDRIDKSHEDPHSGHNKDIVVEDSMNHMDKKYRFHCSPVLTHNEAGTKADNHNQIENHFHRNHTSKSRMWGVEGDHFHTARTYTIDKDSSFDLVAYLNSDYVGASLDKKSTTGECQFLGCKLISWQCKKQTVVATSSTEAEYVATASGCAQVLVFNSPMLHVLRVEMVINSTWMLSKNWLVQKKMSFVQKQKALGKDTSNPLIVGSLLKTIWFSIHHHLTIEVLAIPGQMATGVNTPRSDEDRLKLIELMVFLLQKGVYGEIRITAARLSSYCCQANVSAVCFETLLLLNAQVTSLVCLPNKEIFAGLAQMGYEKPSTKLTFYKDFFSSQWKFLIHTILQSLSAKRTFGNEFSTAMASAVICLSKGQKFNFSKYIFDSLVRNVDSSSKFYMYPRFIQLIIQNQVGDLSTHTTRFISPSLTQKVFANMRMVGKGFLGVGTPLFVGMLAIRQPTEVEVAEAQVQVDAAVAAAVKEHVAENVSHDAIPSPPPHDIPSPSQEPSSPPQQQQISPQAPPQDVEFPTQLQQVLNICSALSKHVENLENDNAAQKLVIVKLKAGVKKLEKANKFKSSKLRRLRRVGASRRVESFADIEDVFNQGRMFDDIDMDEGIELVKDAEVAESEGRHAAQQVEKQAEIYNLDLDHSSKVLSMQEDDLEVQEVVKVVTTAKLITEVVTAAASQPTIPAAAPTVVAAYTRRRKGVIIRDQEEELPLKTPAETPKVKDKEYARKLQEEIDRDHDGFNKDIDCDATYCCCFTRVIIRDPKEELPLKTPAETPKVKDKGQTETGKEYSNTFMAVNPHIYISCIKQFWNTSDVKRLGDVTRLQALVDRKKIVISEAVIREILQLNDAEGVEDDSEVQEVVEVVTTAKLITKVVTAAASQVSAASTTILAAKPTIPAAAPTVVAAYTRRRKEVIIRDPEEELPLKTPAETLKVKDKGKGILIETPKPMKKKDQIEMDAEYARKLQEEIDRDHDGFNKDIDWAAGYKMDFFKGMTYAQIYQEIIKSINETPAQKAAKRRKLSKEAQEAKDLRKRLEVVEDEDDDVFVEATPLAQKVPVVDY